MAKKQINLADRGGRGSAYNGDLHLEKDFFEEIGGKQSGVILHKNGSLEIRNIRIHRTGLEFVGQVSKDEYKIFGQTILQFDTAYQWIVGDYLAYGVENNYGLAQDFAEKLGRDPSTVRDWTYVCNQIELSYRYDNLSFKHHRIVAPLDSKDQQRWLEQASENKWSTSRLNKAINGDGKSQKRPVVDTVIERFEKHVNPKRWQKYSKPEREALKATLDRLRRDIDHWESLD